MEKKFTFAMEIVPMKPPNYILCGKDNHPVSIAEFSDEELTELAEKFKSDLLKRAKELRKP